MEKNLTARPFHEGSQFQKPSRKTLRVGQSISSVPRHSGAGNDRSDSSRTRQVKFADPVDVHEPSLKQNASSLQINRAVASDFKEAKTSEYKTFMKLREETRLKLRTRLPIATNDNLEELNNYIPCRYNSSTPFMPTRKATSIIQKSSPSVSQVSENCELNRTITCQNGINRSQSPIKQNTPFAQGSSSHLKVSQSCEPSFLVTFEPEEMPEANQGSKYMHRGIFSKKRENILQSAEKVLSSEVDALTLDRSDLVSGCLKRLGSGMKLSKLDVLPRSIGKNSYSVDKSLLSSPKADGFHAGFSDTDLQRKRSKCQGVFGGIPSLPALDMIEERDFFENTTKEPISSQADDHITSSFSSRHVLKTDLKNKRKYNWIHRGIQDRRVEDKSDLPIEWITDFGCNSYGYHAMNQMIPQPDYFMPDNFPYHSSTELCDFPDPGVNLQPAEERHTILLLGWDGDVGMEQEPSVPDRASSDETDRLPLTLYTASNLHNQTKGCWFIKVDESRNTISSPCDSSIIDSRDGHFSIPRTAFELERKALPMGVDWAYSNLQFLEPGLSVPDCAASDEIEPQPLTLYTAPPGSSITDSRDCHYSIPRTAFELERKALPMGVDWDYSNLQFLEPELSVLDRVASDETEPLPLTLYTSPPGNSMIALRDGTPMTAFDLRRKTVSIDAEWDYSKLQFHERDAGFEDLTDGSFGDPSFSGFQNQFLGDLSYSFTSFSSLGLRFSHGEKGIFALMPDGLNWY